MSQRILIVGGVAAGASAAARARRLDEHAEIVIFEKGGYVSFANCGLPYYVGDVIKDREQLLLMTPELFWARLRVDARVGHEVLEIDLATARSHAQLWADLARRGNMIGVHDSWLAATCLAHGFRLATSNIREFRKVPGLDVEEWT